jgi:acyl-CoA synthetase (AMP-forming)/AMP-acid ligase II
MTMATTHYVKNIGNMLTDTARVRPDVAGLIHGDKSWSWAELERFANGLAVGLQELGVVPGDRVAIKSANSREMFESMYGIVRTGAVYVPIGSHSSTFEVSQMLDICDARVLIFDNAHGIDLAEIARNRPQLKAIIGIDPAQAAEGVSVLSYSELVEQHRNAPTVSVPVQYDDICWQNFTSGTTGIPKSGMNSHGGLNYMLMNVLATMMPGANWNDSTLAVAPIGHGTGTMTTACTMVGAATVLTTSSRMDVAECWDLIQRHRISVLFAVPTILMRLLRHEGFTKDMAGPLKHVRCGAAPMSRTDLDFAVECLGSAFIRSYGAVEHVGAGTLFRPADEPDYTGEGEDPRDSIGCPRPGTEIGILDEEMRQVPLGEVGEFCLRGSGVFAGYFNNQKATDEAFAGGWYHTGDLARIGSNGFIYLSGRKKEMFKSGGLQISPNEVQNELAKHPAVEEAHLVSVPDSDFGEVGVAAVRLRPDGAATEGELIAFIRSRLAHYKQPRRIFFLTEIPRSANGKVPKPMLRDFLYDNGFLTRGMDVAKYEGRQ